MRTLKYAILGLLMRSPVTGYDIAKEFGDGLGCFWSAKHSQIYPELKRLTDDGLIQFRTVIQGERMEKKLYEITDKGKEDFLCWLLKDPPLDPTPKDVFKLRSYYSQWISTADYLVLLDKQIEKRLAKYTFLSDRLKNVYGDRDIVSLTGSDRGDYLVLLGAVMREQTYLDWLQRSREVVTMWDDSSDAQCEQ